MKVELRTEESRRRNLARDYEHVSRWMTLVASGRTTWQPGREADRGSVVEAMTAGRAETVWSRGCASWMTTVDVADVMRDDFWLLQVEEKAKKGQSSGESTVNGIRPVEITGLDGPEGLAGAEPVSAVARAAARGYMGATMEALVALLQRHRSSLRHCFLAYCKSWPFGISAELLASCSMISGLDDDTAPTTNARYDLLLATCCRLLATCCLLQSTCYLCGHLLRATCCLLLAACCLLLWVNLLIRKLLLCTGMAHPQSQSQRRKRRRGAVSIEEASFPIEESSFPFKNLHFYIKIRFTAAGASLLESGMSEATDGGMTMSEWWRLVQDLGTTLVLGAC